ncbi:hypothetical protein CAUPRSCDRAFT_11274 [Caulochytrium protostelioides]|uniref:Uncharacterized protein n=1 Tax=Caulochytrium protostelioides TaxID=1555241 RepID=A0A4P9X072_9FUNG|nr:hypothetical protein CAUPRSCDRAFT_11274 [Caulochytrium protostelioides]
MTEPRIWSTHESIVKQHAFPLLERLKQNDGIICIPPGDVTSSLLNAVDVLLSSSLLADPPSCVVDDQPAVRADSSHGLNTKLHRDSSATEASATAYSEQLPKCVVELALSMFSESRHCSPSRIRRLIFVSDQICPAELKHHTPECDVHTAFYDAVKQRLDTPVDVIHVLGPPLPRSTSAPHYHERLPAAPLRPHVHYHEFQTLGSMSLVLMKHMRFRSPASADAPQGHPCAIIRLTSSVMLSVRKVSIHRDGFSHTRYDTRTKVDQQLYNPAVETNHGCPSLFRVNGQVESSTKNVCMATGAAVSHDQTTLTYPYGTDGGDSAGNHGLHVPRWSSKAGPVQLHEARITSRDRLHGLEKLRANIGIAANSYNRLRVMLREPSCDEYRILSVQPLADLPWEIVAGSSVSLIPTDQRVKGSTSLFSHWAHRMASKKLFALAMYVGPPSNENDVKHTTPPHDTAGALGDTGLLHKLHMVALIPSNAWQASTFIDSAVTAQDGQKTNPLEASELWAMHAVRISFADDIRDANTPSPRGVSSTEVGLAKRILQKIGLSTNKAWHPYLTSDPAVQLHIFNLQSLALEGQRSEADRFQQLFSLVDNTALGLDAMQHDIVNDITQLERAVKCRTGLPLEEPSVHVFPKRRMATSWESSELPSTRIPSLEMLANMKAAGTLPQLTVPVMRAVLCRHFHHSMQSIPKRHPELVTAVETAISFLK